LNDPLFYFIFIYFCYLNSLGGGTSWHAAGLVGVIRKNYETTQLSKYAVELFEKFEKEAGVGKKFNDSLVSTGIM